jgi:hypothetical protein
MRKTVVFLVPALVTLLVGCQAIFTFSPLSGLKRDPSTMSPEQRLTYAQDALASGDPAAMQKAYDAIKNDTGGPAQYTTAQLGIELSGVPTVFRDLANNPGNVSAQLGTLNAYIAAHNLDPALMVAAAGQLVNAAAAGVTLTTMDYIMGSMGMMLGYAYAATTTWNVSPATVSHANAVIAKTFLDLANVGSLASNDPLLTLFQNYDTYLGTF